MLLAAAQNILTLAYASPVLRSDPNFMFSAVYQNGLALEYASPALRNNLTIVLAAVVQNGLALELASTVLKNHPSAVFTAVSQNGLALQFAADIFKDLDLTVLAAVKNNTKALEYASPDFIKNLEFLTEVAFMNEDHLEEKILELSDYLSDPIAREFFLRCLEKKPSIFPCIPEKFSTDSSFIRDACARNRLVANNLPDALSAL